MKAPEKKIPYSKYFIAFLDVLGFKKLVFSENVSSKRKIEEYFKEIKDVITILENIKNKQRLKAIIISDSVILSIPFEEDHNDRVHKLRHICVAIAKIQYALAKKNIWLRGAISSGKSYFNHDENMVVGPAYINAYLLEKELSIFPRVILDNKIIGELEEESSQALIDKININYFLDWNTDILYNWKKKGQGNMLLKQDVPLFIDYFSPVFKNLREAYTVINNIGKNIYSDNIAYPKYRWVVDYLISLCKDQMQRESTERANILNKKVYLKLEGF